MRIRTIKPDFWRSDDIAALSIEDRLLFIGLWSYVDDNGVGRDEPQLIQCDLFPLDPLTEGSVRVHGGLKRLSEQGLITRFEGPDGRRYLQIDSWDRHQRINRPSRPRFPRYDNETCTLSEGSLSPHDGLAEGSSPEQGTGNREQGVSNTPFSPSGDDSSDAEPHTPLSGQADEGGEQQTELLGDTLLLTEPQPPPKPDPRPRTRQRRQVTYPEEFEAFWEAYPRHSDKKAALRAWTRAVKEVPNSELIAAARRYAHDPARKPEYTKHAATWLNAGSWANEPAEPPQPRALSQWDYTPFQGAGA